MRANVRVNIKDGRSFVPPSLLKAMKSWDQPAPLGGALTVRGHDYWWILEYGSGAFFDGVNSFLDGELAPVLYNPTGKAPTGKSSWELDATLRPGRTKAGAVRSKKRPCLKFRNLAGVYVYPQIVTVTGQGSSQGFIRRSIRAFNKGLLTDLRAMRSDGFIPDREEVIEAINEHLAVLFETVVAQTPESDNSEGDHLRDAWGVDLAR